MPETYQWSSRSLIRRLIAFTVPDGQMQRLRDLQRTDPELYDAIRDFDRWASANGPETRTSTDVATDSKKAIVTVKEAAEMLDIDPNSVRRLIRNGDIAKVSSNPYRIAATSITDYLDARAA